MQRYLDPEGLRQRGLEHFDAWAATFGEVIDAMEITPDGSCHAQPQPLRPLYQSARASADVPVVRRRADGRHARPAPAALGRGTRPRSLLARCPRSSAISKSSSSSATSAYGTKGSTRGWIMPWRSPPTDASWPSTPGCSRRMLPISPTRRSTRSPRTSPPSGTAPPRRAARSLSSAIWASTRRRGATRSMKR